MLLNFYHCSFKTDFREIFFPELTYFAEFNKSQAMERWIDEETVTESVWQSEKLISN